MKLYDHLHTLQSSLESGQDARIVQIDFSRAFDRVNQQGILYNLCSVGIGGSVGFHFNAVLPSPGGRVIVSEFLNRDIGRLVSVVPSEGSMWIIGVS